METNSLNSEFLKFIESRLDRRFPEINDLLAFNRLMNFGETKELLDILSLKAQFDQRIEDAAQRMLRKVYAIQDEGGRAKLVEDKFTVVRDTIFEMHRDGHFKFDAVKHYRKAMNSTVREALDFVNSLNLFW